MRPLSATILCVWEIWSGSNNRMYMYHVFHWLTDFEEIHVPLVWMQLHAFYQGVYNPLKI